ncbi:hypothetical protein PPL_02851 [Heterostelium album PN500]|uniref:C2H2-type domain-containing protein n=1 Tax=Heterostelium pallidum (strain ATCC 26659 / Pp 5 / PN500) TaxID=670386 RepID=D3B385_HETP5|nr:hypothetical protein PPL_02851 [Heterostelium album PN500]EFA83783.1 hypothetical protein PPL_02851 [Heterostelium album PN500]|eukprot:XP_020435900.1 hypothetical protein PPL_02851 [Heterostelium album PN500]
MTRGKQKIDAQKRNQEKNQPAKGSQLEHRAAAFKIQCNICMAMLTHENQVNQHYESKHPGKPINPKMVQ